MSIKLSLLLLIVCSIYLQTFVQLANAGWFSSGPVVVEPTVPKTGLARLASLSFKELLNDTAPEPIIPPNATQEQIEQFKSWHASPLYVPTFEPQVIAISPKQLEITRKNAIESNIMYKDILADAVQNKDSFAPSVKLMFKWAFKLLNMFIKLRIEEMKLEHRVEQRPEFFGLLADLIEYSVKESASTIKEKGYTKQNVDVAEFHKITNEGWDYLKKVFLASPVGIYIRFDKVIAFNDDKSHPKHGLTLPTFVIDQLAKFRVIGYEQTMFVAKRLVIMLRLFAQNKIPDANKV